MGLRTSRLPSASVITPQTYFAEDVHILCRQLQRLPQRRIRALAIVGGGALHLPTKWCRGPHPQRRWTVPRTSTASPDYADWGRYQKVGGVIIERVWLEYSAHELLTIRAGQFLTPYGIWNVDHGSPVVIGITRPFIVGNEWLPNRQTGLELYGSTGVNSTQFGYHLDALQSPRSNRRVSIRLSGYEQGCWLARVWAKQDSPIGMSSVGVRQGTKAATLTVPSQIQLHRRANAIPHFLNATSELSLGSTFQVYMGRLPAPRARRSPSIRITSDNYRPTPMFSMPGSGWQPDSRVWGYYALTGYRFKWNGVMTHSSRINTKIGARVSSSPFGSSQAVSIPPFERTGDRPASPRPVAAGRTLAGWIHARGRNYACGTEGGCRRVQ